MATQTTGNFPKHLWPGLHGQFGASYDEKTMQHAKVFDMDSSDKAYEEVVEGTSYGLAAIKNEGAPIVYDDREQTNVAKFTHMTTGLGAKITMEAIEDNKYEAPATQAATLLGMSLRQTKETSAFNILNRGFSGSYVGPDGQALFSAAHPTRSGNQSNQLGTAADLSEASVEDMLIQIRNAKNARGLRIELKGTCLIVSVNDMFEAHRIMNSVGRVGTDFNDPNAIKDMGMLPGGVISSEFLTDTDAWFIKTSAKMGLMGFNRRAAKLSRDNEFDTENLCIKGTERFVFGWSDFRGVYGTPGAA